MTPEQASGFEVGVKAELLDGSLFATYAKWNGLNGPTGNELVLEQLSQFFTE